MSETALAWMPQPSGGANIIRCLWCFTLLMNLHDFVAEPVNPEHIFHDAHTVSFCLTADHIATCHMFLCPHQVSTVLVCLWTRVVWKTFGTSDDGIWSHSWSPPRRGGDVTTSMESHGEVWCQDSWQRIQWSATSLGTRQSVHGCSGRQRLVGVTRQLVYGCSGMHRLTVSRQLVQQMQQVLRRLNGSRTAGVGMLLDSRSSEVSVLISGRLRRLG